MINLGLTSAQKAALTATLLTHHSIFIKLEVLTLAGDVLEDLSDRILSGEVIVDRTSSPTRSCTVSLLDTARTLNFDSDSPADGALYVDRMLRVEYGVNVPGFRRVDIPVFTGPISKMDRTNDVVNLEAQGKEALAMGAAWKTITYKKNHNRADVIHDILALTGETKFTFPTYNARLPKDLSIGLESIPWEVASRVARGMSLQLYYNGLGRAVLRRPSTNNVFDFRNGDGGSVLSVPQVSYSTDELKNIVHVKGDKKVAATARAPYAHPMSPGRLGRNGQPRYLLESIEDSSIRTNKEAQQLARTTLNRALLNSVAVAFDALPIPFLEEGDHVRIITSEFATSFYLNQFTIPLTVGDAMPIGYTKATSTNKTRIRKK